MATNEKGAGSHLAAFLLGAALGAMGALLLAPKSGKRLRRDIARQGDRMKRRGKDLKLRAEDTMDELVERGNEALESAKSAVTEAQQLVEKAARSVAK